MLQALTGKPSFKNAKDLYTWCQTGEGYPDQLLRELQVSEDAIDFLHSVMAFDPAARPTAKAACEHRWWAESDIRPARGWRLASILGQPGKLSRRRSSLEVHFPPEVCDARQSSLNRQQHFNRDRRNSVVLPYPRSESTNSLWAVPPPFSPQTDPHGVYQHPYPMSTPHLPMDLYMPPHQRQAESDYIAKPDLILRRPSRTRRPSLADDTSFRSLTAPHNWPYVLRQHENNQARITTGPYDGPYGPQQQDSGLRKQVRFVSGSHDRSPGSPVQSSHREGQTRINPSHKKASVPDSRELTRILTLGDLTIDTSSHQPVRILVNPAKTKSKKRPQTSQIAGQSAMPGGSLRTDETVQSKYADDQLRDATAQLSQKEAVTRLRDDIDANSLRGEAPASVVTWHRIQSDEEPRTGENHERHRDPSWAWLGDGAWTEQLAARGDVRQHHAGLEAR